MRSPQQRHRVLAGVSRSRILQVLGGSARPMGIRELAETLGLHPNTVRQHLDQLVEADLVTCRAASPTGRGRPGLHYSATPASDEQDPEAYKALASVLAEQLARAPDGTRMALTAGERWGRELAREATATAPAPEAAPIERLVELLDRTGFAPDTAATADGPIGLRHCPFGALARDQGEVVCGVHLGLMRGILQELDAPFDATRLEPFVTPGLCLAHLGSLPEGRR